MNNELLNELITLAREGKLSKDQQNFLAREYREREVEIRDLKLVRRFLITILRDQGGEALIRDVVREGSPKLQSLMKSKPGDSPESWLLKVV